MGTRPTRDDALEQIRAELKRRAIDALKHPGRGVSREEAVARALASVEAVRARKL